MSTMVLASWLGAVAGEVLLTVALQSEAIGFYQELGAVERAGVNLAATLVVGFAVLGILPWYSTRVVDTARRSPIISLCIGIPAIGVLVTFLYLGHLIADHSVGVFFAIPLVSIGITFLPVWTALGTIVLGGVVASRVGFGWYASWVVFGAVIVGLASLHPVAFAALIALAAVLGVGSGARVLVGSGITQEPEERVVPPANKV